MSFYYLIVLFCNIRFHVVLSFQMICEWLCVAAVVSLLMNNHTNKDHETFCGKGLVCSCAIFTGSILCLLLFYNIQIFLFTFKNLCIHIHVCMLVLQCTVSLESLKYSVFLYTYLLCFLYIYLINCAVFFVNLYFLLLTALVKLKDMF